MKRFFRDFLALFLFVCATSCITNSVPYPVAVHAILGVEGVGFELAEIDGVNRVVYIDLEETTDIQNLEIESVTTTEEAQLSTEIVGTHDMRTPLYVTLSQYQNYEWSIVARQSISRRFKVAGQIGGEVFDVDNLTVTVAVTMETDLANVEVREMKFAADSITTYDIEKEALTDFSSSYRSVGVTCHGRMERWRINLVPTDIKAELTRCDVWAQVAWLEGIGDTSQECGFKYRTAGSDEWTTVDATLVEVGDGTFTARLGGLSQLTSYEFVACVGDDLSETAERTTEQAMQLPNSGMEEWMQSGNPWYPYSSTATAFWGTGNPGSTTLGSSYNLTTSSTDIRPESEGELSANLQSKNINAIVYKTLAAGNLFVGSFAGTDGTDGILTLGRPYTSHPVALRFWVKYKPGSVDYSGSAGGVNVGSGDSDTGIAYIALGSWTKEKYGTYNDKGTDESPYVIATKEQSTFFNPNGEDVSAYGEHIFASEIGEWQQITIPLKYTDTSINHTHIIIVFSACRYGDYYLGSTSSLMQLDDIELLYE